MLKEISIILLSSCCILYAFQSCKSEAEPQALDSLDIQGRWELVSASVDGKETDRLRSLYFVFLPDTSLQTNIFGSETNFKFSMQSEQIIQFSEPQLTYTILAHTDSTLQVQTQLRGKEFTMDLAKAKPKRPSSEDSEPAD